MNVAEFAISAQLIIDMKFGGCITVYQILFTITLTDVFDGTESRAAAFKRFSKSCSKLTVEIGVDQWVQGAVEIPNPEYSRDNYIGTLARVAKSRYHVPENRRETNTYIWQTSKYEKN